MRIAKLLLLAVLLGSAGAAFLYSLSHSSVYYVVPGSSPTPTGSNLTFLVLGRTGAGEGGIWEGAPNLTDAIMLVDLNTGTGVLNLISIPRDLYGTWGGSEYKINEAFERGKMSELLGGIREITGISANNYVVVDLNTISVIVNALGGVDVDLPYPVIDKVSGYELAAGEHRLDGATAVWLMRNRYASEGDFFRQDNQRLVIEAIIGKLRGMGVSQRIAFIIKVLPTTSKDVSNMNFGSLLGYASDLGKIKFNGITLGFATGLLESSSTPVGNGNMYILIPTAGMNNYSEIRAYVQMHLQ